MTTPRASVLTFSCVAALLSVGSFTSVAGAQAQKHDAGAESVEPPASDADEPAQAQPSQDNVKQAGQHFERGLQLYNDAEYRLALIEFERAYQLVPNYRVKYNIAQVSIQIGRYAHALRALEAYLEEGGDQISAERRAQVQADLNMLAGRTAKVNVTSNVDGAEILVDDKVVATTPLDEKLLIDAGEHRMTVRQRGYQPHTEQLTLAGGDDLDLPLDLVKIKEKEPVVIVKEVPNRTPQPPVLDQGSREKPFPYATVGWVTTGAFAAGAVVTGIVGLTAYDEYDSLSKPQPDQDPEQVRTDRDAAKKKARNWFLASDILKGAAAVAGAASLYLTITGTDSTREEKPVARGRRPVQLTGHVGLNQVWVEGRF